jgi:hypothetical protein
MHIMKDCNYWGSAALATECRVIPMCIARNWEPLVVCASIIRKSSHGALLSRLSSYLKNGRRHSHWPATAPVGLHYSLPQSCLAHEWRNKTAVARHRASRGLHPNTQFGYEATRRAAGRLRSPHRRPAIDRLTFLKLPRARLQPQQGIQPNTDSSWLS